MFTSNKAAVWFVARRALSASLISLGSMVVSLSATRLLSSEKSGNGSDIVLAEVGESFIVALVLTLALLALPMVFFVLSRKDSGLAWKIGLLITAAVVALIAALLALLIESAMSEVATPVVTLVGAVIMSIGFLFSWSLFGLIWKLIKSEFNKAKGGGSPGADDNPDNASDARPVK